MHNRTHRLTYKLSNTNAHIHTHKYTHTNTHTQVHKDLQNLNKTKVKKIWEQSLRRFFTIIVHNLKETGKDYPLSSHSNDSTVMRKDEK